MKEYSKIFSLLAATALYCVLVAVSASNTSCYNGSFESTDEGFSALTEVFSSSAVPNEDSAHQFNFLSSLFAKINLNKSSVFRDITELILDCNSSKYILFARNSIERPEPTDFIFPHHYF
ncbi:MAG: hypothetical protein ACM3MI_15290 [Clostridiales bacterium]